MRRAFPVGWSIVVFVFIMGIVGWRVYYASNEFTRVNKVAHVINAPSRLYARLVIRYDKPPIYEEAYNMQDVEGISTYSYLIRGYSGKQITIRPKNPRAIHDVSYFFGKLDHIDGIWQLTDKPPRGNTSVHYTVYVKQLADYQEGERTITFTDPHYWATTNGREFHIDLSKQNPSDLLKMQSTALADPRYEQVVNDFRAFGPDEFRKRFAEAQARIRSGK